MSQHGKSSQTESARIATSKCIQVTTLYHSSPTQHETHVARHMFLSRDKSVDLTGVSLCHATLLNVCDIIFSAYDKFLECEVTSLIYRFLDP